MATEEELSIIYKVIEKISPRYTFKDYEVEDIKQEAFIICLDAMNRYDGKRSLENFLSSNLSNRLKNLVRDNHYVKNNIHKKKVKSPQYITDDSFINNSYDLEKEVINADIMSIIDEKLPAIYREDLLKFMNDVSLPKNRREKLISEIRRIINNEEG